MGDRSLRRSEAVIYQLPEGFNFHTPRYAHAAMVGLGDHRSAHLPSLLVVTAVQSIGHDPHVPPLASVVGKSHVRAHKRF